MFCVVESLLYIFQERDAILLLTFDHRSSGFERPHLPNLIERSRCDDVMLDRLNLPSTLVLAPSTRRARNSCWCLPSSVMISTDWIYSDLDSDSEETSLGVFYPSTSIKRQRWETMDSNNQCRPLLSKSKIIAADDHSGQNSDDQ